MKTIPGSGDGETHFSPHRYRIATYTLNTQSGRYALRDEFTTENKYSTPSKVLTAEMPQIIAHSR
jgi:hypothetical protein